jgi:hypothetical protein
MKRLIHISLVLLLSFPVLAQVEVDKSVQLTGTSASEKQITGVADPTTNANLVNAATAQSNSMNYAMATGTDSLLFSLTPAIGSYNAGLMVNFMAPNTNTGAIELNVNNLGYVPLKKEVTRDIVVGEIKAGKVYTAIYDGSNFQLITPIERACPAGFVDVNDKFCIEIDESSTIELFWDATIDCMDRNARICTWGEWYYACQNASLGLNDMTNNFELVNTAVNSTDQILTVGGSVLGCEGRVAINSKLTSARYRCCYSK